MNDPFTQIAQHKRSLRALIRKHPILFLFFLLILTGAGYVVYRIRQPQMIPVRTTKVERVDELVSIVSASGEVRAHDMVDIQAEVAGVITELPVVEGQVVKKGDVLLKLDDFQAQMELDSMQGRFMAAKSDVDRAVQGIATARTNLSRQEEMIKSAVSDLDQAQITYERDQSSLKRYEALLKERAISQDEYEVVDSKSRISGKRVESARTAIEQAKDQLSSDQVAIQQGEVQKAQAEQNLKVAEASLKRAKDQYSKTIIKAPLNGVIVKLNVDIGERAVPGIQSNPQATLMTLADMTHIESEMKVNETDIVRVKLGQKAKMTVDALTDFTSLTGHVTEISAAPIDTNARGMQTNNQEGKDFKVVITLDSPPSSIRIGMLCEAEITIETRQNVLSIPIAALTLHQGEPDEKGSYIAPPKPVPGGSTDGKVAKAEEKKPEIGGDIGKGKGKKGKRGENGKKKGGKKDFQGVFVKGADDMAHFRPVKTGIMGEMDLEVLDGLKEGDDVITGPLASLRQLDEWTLVRMETADEKITSEQHK